MYLIRPCGIRISHTEMYTAESLCGVFTSLVEAFSDTPLADDIQGVVYDRACDLHPYLERLALEGNVGAARFKQLRFIVDVWHAEKHTMPKCDISHPDCQYHPDLNKFSDVRKMNTEICEQSFHCLNPFKHITRNMTYGKRMCLLKIIDSDYNSRLSSSLS